ncbi:MAG: hypothetical protein KDA91_12925 [Planctomycetaceae bacterium]|nr:hypothetical protein [Planctomycetaceae bacterium]
MKRLGLTVELVLAACVVLSAVFVVASKRPELNLSATETASGKVASPVTSIKPLPWDGVTEESSPSELLTALQSAPSDRHRETVIRALLASCRVSPFKGIERPGEKTNSVSLTQVLDNIASQIHQQSQVVIHFLPDTLELELEGIGLLEDVQLTVVEMENVSAELAIVTLLNGLEPQLSYMIRGNLILITTLVAAESDENLEVQLYDVEELLPMFSGSDKENAYTRLMTAIENATSPPAKWFRIDWEGGRIDAAHNLLIIRQTGLVHRRIQNFLQSLLEQKRSTASSDGIR